MQYTALLREHLQPLAALLLFLVCSVEARGTDSYDSSSNQLTIPAAAIGGATYTDVVVTPDTIQNIEQGAPGGTEDSYDPAINQLLIPSVAVGDATYTNVLITVGNLISIGSVSGADTYSDSQLTISSVQVLGGRVYNNVVITVGQILSAAGGMPKDIQDLYDPSSNKLTIAAVQVGGRVYTNVVITVGQLVSVGGSVSEQVLHSFGSGTDGVTPQGLIQTGGIFYGTTSYGGAYTDGTIFWLTASGSEGVLYSFGAGDDGNQPLGGLIRATDGYFYGTTEIGGAHAFGTVFRITPDGAEAVLYSFTGGNDGAYPGAALVQATDGNLYGTTTAGGAFGSGVVFRIAPSGAENTVYTFTGGNDGGTPFAPLIQASDGNLYGTTQGGGANGWGTVFKVAPSGSQSVVYSFADGSDGSIPAGGVIQGSDGNFYGLTSQGGVFAQQGGGTLFLLTAAGALTVLHSFGAAGDGVFPGATLLQGSDGSLYGTTTGTAALPSAGIVFRINPSGTETILAIFSGGPDADEPTGALVLGSDGALYGTTTFGGGPSGANGYGTVFRIAL